MRDFVIAFAMVMFVIFYVWQNIEVIKIKMNYRKGLQVEGELIKLNDRLRYEIERFRRMDVIDQFAGERGMVQVTPRDFEIIIPKKAVKKGRKK